MSSHHQEGTPPPSSTTHEGIAPLAPLPQTGSTPVIKKQAGHAPFASEVPGDVRQIRRQLVSEMTGRWVGPMPVEQFLDAFLPASSEQLPSIAEDPFREVFDESSESTRYTPFIDAIAGWTPNFVALNSSNKPDTDENLKPDVSIYPVDQAPSRTNFSQMELWVEFKRKGSALPFQDPKVNSSDASSNRTPFTPETKEARDARGQLITYAVAHHARQFRHFSFSIFIADNHARFLRWDHAGTIVSAAFNFREHPEIMASFLWRFSHLSEAQRGYDMSVRPVGLSTDVARRVKMALAIDGAETPLFEYDLPGLSGKGRGYGPFPPLPSRSLVGRCTRTLPVYFIPDQVQQNEDVTTHAEPEFPHGSEEASPWEREGVVYLKDTWRFLSNDPDTKIMAEHEIYELLHAKKTPNIPKHVAGGDVPGGMTLTQDFLDADWLFVNARVTPFQHYRLVLGVVGHPLTKFKCTKELAQAIYDAMQGHWHAYEIVGILHRDISVGNILITDDGHGLLIDWEMAKLVGEVGARRYDRTGTWQFMSAALLRDTCKMHTLSDDIESFIHVIGWLILRFIPSAEGFDPGDRAANMTKFDETNFHRQGRPIGGQAKILSLAGGKYPAFGFRFRQPTPLSHLLSSLCKPFKMWYSEDPPTADDRAKLSDPTNFPEEALELEDLRGRIDNYDQNWETLTSSEWFLSTIRAALGKAGWPEDDGADETVFVPSTGTLTELQDQQRTSQLRTSQNQFIASKASSGSSKRRAASPAPEPGAKRCRGASAPLTSSSHMTS